MECIKFIGVDPTTAGSYNSSHAGSYPSSRVCIPERCFTKCMHCIEFNHPPSEEPVLSSRRSSPIPQMLSRHREKRSTKRSTAAKIPGYRILSTIKITIDIYRYIERKSEVESIKFEKFEKFLIFCHIDMISAFNLLEIYIIVYVQSSSIKFQDIDNPGCG